MMRRIKIKIENIQRGDRLDLLPEHEPGQKVLEIEISLANVYLTPEDGREIAGYIGQDVFIWREEEVKDDHR